MATPKMMLLALAAASAAIASPVSAGYRSTEVKTVDLDLSSAAGQATLQGRIDRAVRQVCRVNVARNLGERQDAEKCVADAQAAASAKAAQRVAAFDKNKRNVTLASD